MTQTNHIKTTIFLAALLATIALALAATGRPAKATFPGTSGAIAFTSNRDGGTDANNIFRMNVDGFGQTRLTETTGKNMQPAWSTDGSKIAFINSQNGVYDVYRMRADGSDETPLTGDSAYDFAPAWGLDGTKIVFASTRFNPSGDIFLMTLSSS
jgi:Tol biopolymer transport system component